MAAMELFASISILLTGVVCAWCYLRWPGSRPARAAHPFVGNRPWRQVGAAICLVVSVMFVVGIYAVDVPDRPVPYAIYWIIMLGLVVWLFALAVRDVMYTRKLVRRWRQDIADEIGGVHRGSAGATEHRRP